MHHKADKKSRLKNPRNLCQRISTFIYLFISSHSTLLNKIARIYRSWIFRGIQNLIMLVGDIQEKHQMITS